jgi:hypothetical protein
MSGVSNAWTIDDVIERRAGESPDAIRRNTSVATSGDVFVSIAPGWQEIDDDSTTDSPATSMRAASATAPAFFLTRNHQHSGRRPEDSPHCNRDFAHPLTQRGVTSETALVKHTDDCAVNKNTP